MRRTTFGSAAMLTGLALTMSSSLAQTPGGVEGGPFGRGVNFGNALDAPDEGAWGLTIQERYVEAIAEAGFDTVRLPVKWSGHAAADAPYTIDPDFLDRVDEVVGWLLARDLRVIIDFHHYDEMSEAPAEHVERWMGIWEQVAERFADAPESVAFELLNEPNGALDAELWNAMIERAVARIRETDPDRWIVVGPVDWNAIGALPSLELPDDDRLVLTVHYYDPFEFTHQGADWVDPSPPTGTTWTGEQLTPAGGWADWSWDTGREYGSDLAITYRQGWAGYYLEAGSPVTGYTELAVRTSADRDLIVVCGPFDGAPHASITTVAGVETAIPLDACGGMPVVERIVLQNGTDSAQEPFVVETLELRGPDGTLPLLVTEREAIAQAFDQVADVAERAGGIPVLVGEFGAFEAGDLDSRVRYTRAVRGAVEARGFAWTYWEFGAGFGVYDITTDTWRPGLLDALLGGLTRRGGPPWRSPAAGGVGSPTSWAG